MLRDSPCGCTTEHCVESLSWSLYGATNRVPEFFFHAKACQMFDVEWCALARTREPEDVAGCALWEDCKLDNCDIRSERALALKLLLVIRTRNEFSKFWNAQESVDHGFSVVDGLDSDFSIEFWNETAPKLKELRLQFVDFRWISMDKVLRIVLGDEKRRFKFWRTYSLEMNNKLTK
ncbi:hypothetical protein RCL_jg9625.t2 [Rhizophagus clarus]|uniref:Uncharacterized protein n=1 Tax=Rhizophagus clarus TaxID=94130 RepID=A0A8H3LZT7_9GLOM|nr:hypothetical protein RCL_jg9625.t2 [Rhizophagus clarus]